MCKTCVIVLRTVTETGTLSRKDGGIESGKTRDEGLSRKERGAGIVSK